MAAIQVPHWIRAVFRQRPAEERARAVKERVYASFTGLAIVTVLALDAAHASAVDSFLTLLAGIVGISIAGFVAEVIGYQIGHGMLPDRTELLTMVRIAAGAFGSASVALIALFAAWTGWLSIDVALQISVGIYFITLAVVALVAAHRTRLPWRQQLVALIALIGLGATVVLVLALAHGH
jgi:uncharacterized membrane protein